MKETYIRIDERTVDDPAKICWIEEGTDWWYWEGMNHRIEDGHIKRDFEGKAWFVHVQSAEDVVGVIESLGVQGVWLGRISSHLNVWSIE